MDVARELWQEDNENRPVRFHPKASTSHEVKTPQAIEPLLTKSSSMFLKFPFDNTVLGG